MPRKMGRNYFNLCFIKFKRPIITQSSAITPSLHTTDRDQTRLFSTTTTTTATAATFIKNYNSLYEYTTSKSFSSSSSSSFSEDDPKDYTAVDFVTAFTSHRFFFSSPGRSNSIIESTTSSSSSSYTTSDSGELLFHNSMAIPTISPDPYADFRRSMQEMVESLEEIDGKKSSWEFIHELLLCYLALNPKNTHKYILGAFADLAGMIKPPLVPPYVEGEIEKYEIGELCNVGLPGK